MTITHTCPGEVIQALQIKLDEEHTTCDRLRIALQQARQHNAILTARLLNLQTTDVTPHGLAEAMIAGCPQWRAVTKELLLHFVLVEESE